MPEERQGFSENRHPPGSKDPKDIKDIKDPKDCKDKKSPCLSFGSFWSLLGAYIGFPTLIIHGIPNRSTSMPNRTAQKVSSNGALIFPFSASAL